MTSESFMGYVLFNFAKEMEHNAHRSQSHGWPENVGAYLDYLQPKITESGNEEKRKK